MTFTAIAAIARPFPARLPRMQATRPTMARTAPTSAAKNDMLLMIGIKDVTSAMIPSTRPEMASPDRDCFGCSISTFSLPLQRFFLQTTSAMPIISTPARHFISCELRGEASPLHANELP